MQPTTRKYVLWIPIVLLCLFYLFKAINFPANDFANYYFSGAFLANGNLDSSIYFPYEFNKAIAALGHSGIFASYAPNSPFLAVLFAPFSFLPLATAKILFNLTGIALFLFSLRRIILHYNIPDFCMVLLPFIFFVPIKNELLFGQVYFLLFFLLAETWLACEKKRWFKMAVLLSFAILLKIFPVLLLLVFAFRKQYKPLLYVLGCSFILIAFSMLFTGIRIWEFYFLAVLPKAFNGEIAGEYVANYQSVFMFLKQLLVFDSQLNPAGFNLPVLFAALMMAFKIKLAAIGFYISKITENSLFVLAYWLFAMVLLSPYGSTYTLILLIFAFFALVKSPYSNVVKIAGMLLLFFLNWVPVAKLFHEPFPFCYLRLFALLLLFAILVWQKMQYLNLKTLSIVVFLPFVVVLISNKKTVRPEDNLLKNAPILIYDFAVSSQQLTYYYWDENGENARSIPFKSTKIAAAACKQNQVFYQGKQLTNDFSNKKKPIFTGNRIVYLSDSGRGIGFYTLKVIEAN